MDEEDRHILYRAGEPSAYAYVVKNSSLFIEGEHCPPFTINTANLLSGVIELFLTEEGVAPDRLFDLATNPEAEVTKIEFDTVLEMAQKWEYGISANRFLAAVLTATNDIVRETIRKLPYEWQVYQERATYYVDLVTRLFAIYQTTQIHEYGRLAVAKRSVDLYREGENFKREALLNPITFDASSMDLAERFTQDTLLCRTGDTADAMYVLLEGSVLVSKQNRLIATISEHGSAFGELAFFLNGRRTADLIATKGAAVFRLEKEKLAAFHSTHPRLFIQIARTLAKRVSRNFKKLQFYQARNPGEKNEQLASQNAAARRQLESFVDDAKKLLRLAANPELSKFLSEVNSSRTMRELVSG